MCELVSTLENDVKYYVNKAKEHLERAKELKSDQGKIWKACGEAAFAVYDCLIALALHFSKADERFRSVLNREKPLGPGDYEDIALLLSEHMGGLPIRAVDVAFTLHSLGYLNNLLGSRSLEVRLPVIEKFLEETIRITGIKP